MINLNLLKKTTYCILILAFISISLQKPVFSGGSNEAKPPVINARAAVVMEASSGRVIYSKNATEKRAIASTTKIMTALVALENGNLDDEVTISKRAASIGGSVLGLREGQIFSLRELLYGMMLASGNDAAIAVAEHIGGSVEGFAKMMNEKALSIGAADSYFVTPHGLDAYNQYSTAYDLAIITRYAIKNPVFSQIVSTTSYYIPEHGLNNTNELLSSCPGVDGVKTGYTSKAGRCLVTTALRNDMRLISVVLGSPTRTARANASRALLEYAYKNYRMVNLLNAGDIYTKVPVYRGIKGSMELKTTQTIKIPLTDAEEEILEVRESIPDMLKAPVYGGLDIGFVEYVLKGEVVAQSMLTTSCNIRKKRYSDYLIYVFKQWTKMFREGIFAGESGTESGTVLQIDEWGT